MKPPLRGRFLSFGRIVVMATNQNTAYVSISDYRKMVTVLRKVQPKVMSGLRSKVREVAAPAQSAISNAIPAVQPLSGMVRVHHGTKTWNYKAPAKTVKFDMRMPSKKSRYGVVSLAKLRVVSVGSVIADMAGRSGKYVDMWTRTKPYMYRYRNGVDGERTHAINGQGRAMIAKLNGRLGKKPSRFAWPAFEKVGGVVREKAANALKETIAEINRSLR